MAIPLGPRRFRSMSPGVKPAPGDAEAAAQQLERIDAPSPPRRSETSPALVPEEGCCLFYDLPLFPQNPILFSESAELVTLHGREARLALGPIGAGPGDPGAQRRFRQIEIAGDRARRLAVVQDEAHRLGFEVVVKVPARAPAFRSIGHSGHRSRLSKDVHEIGSSAPVVLEFSMQLRGPQFSTPGRPVRHDYPLT